MVCIMIKANVKLDAKGLACPMPIVRTRKAVKELLEGQVLEVQATDKGSTADLAAWAKSSGHQYIGTKEEGNVLYHYIRKCNADTKEGNTEVSYEPTIHNDDLLLREGLILDVRESAEFAFGHIPGAVSIPLGELESRMNEIDSSKEIYVICRTGTRSDLAANMLSNAGYKKVYNVLPGMTGWTHQLKKEVE